YPTPARFWQMIERHKCTIFYTAPTAIRSLIKASESNDEHHPKKFDLTSLRIIVSVGEPINPEAWMWYFTHVGRERCTVVDPWWPRERTFVGYQVAEGNGHAHLVTPAGCHSPQAGFLHPAAARHRNRHH